MEDNQRFIPTFAGAPHFRLPFRSVFMPVVPCVLDGCLSLLELISKLQYIINQYHDAIEANHTDIMSLYEYVEGALDDLREYIDTQDAAMLTSAKAYTDSAITTLTAYVDAQDAAQLAAAKAYTDAEIAALKAYTDAQLAGKQDILTFDQVPTDGSTNPVESNGIYDALAGKQNVLTFDQVPTDGSTNPVESNGIYDALAGKQNVLTFDQVPTDGSTNPVESNGIYDALAAGVTTVKDYADNKFQIKNAYYTATRTNTATDSTITCDLDFSSILAFANQNRIIIIKMQTINTIAGAYPIYNNEWFYFTGLKYDAHDTPTDAVFLSFTGTLNCSALSGWTFIPS